MSAPGPPMAIPPGRVKPPGFEAKTAVYRPPAVRAAAAAAKEEQVRQFASALKLLCSKSSVDDVRTRVSELVRQKVVLLTKERQMEAAMEAAVAEGGAPPEQEDSLKEKVDSLLKSLHHELDSLDTKIGGKLKLLDRDEDGKLTLEELAGASGVLRDTLLKGEAKWIILDLMDGNGQIDVGTVLQLADDPKLKRMAAGQAEEASSADDLTSSSDDEATLREEVETAALPARERAGAAAVPAEKRAAETK
uniref:EF-hand domain-containing protein n=1 Tax=Pyramimonas obovata TaxID=1411642 RepID=A0A7S0R5W9_9CHLO|mmetsp:Transcript_26368/g.57261  ORF Transcript_26368/g.57261 Transcript_26368/m.57261 type:complete len:249 (+) Transcript_26368:3-749(+)